MNLKSITEILYDKITHRRGIHKDNTTEMVLIERSAIGRTVLALSIIAAAGVFFISNPMSAIADDADPAMNVEYRSKEDIVNYYNEHPFVRDMDTTYSEEPNVFAPYNPGAVSQDCIDNVTNVVNLARYTAGLSGMVVPDSELNKKAQAGALCDAAIGDLTHTPYRPRDMSDELYNLGKEGASSSNIAYASYNLTLPATIRMYLSDSDSGNRKKVGHRRWILYPVLYKIGFGQVENYSATHVIGGQRNYSAHEYGVAWPAQNTPVELLSYAGDGRGVSGYPWSISFGENPGDNINVTLIDLKTGNSWHFSNTYGDDGEFYVNNSGYGQKGCVIFFPENLSLDKGDQFEVRINNIGISGYQDSLTYRVNIFSLKDEDLSDDIHGSSSNIGNNTGDNGSVPSDTNGLYFADDGIWHYYVNGNIDYSYTGLVPNEFGWWYVRGGSIDWSYTGMAANEYGWWYVSNGSIDWSYTGLACNEFGWWYMTNGALDWNYTGLALNEYGWWYVNHGGIDWFYEGLALNEYGWWYVSEGCIDWYYEGLASNEYGWWYVKNGCIDWSHTGIEDNEYGWWYVVNGCIAWNYTGYITDEYGTWTVINGYAFI